MSWASSGCSAPLQVTQEKERKGHSPSTPAFKIIFRQRLSKALNPFVTTYFWWSTLHAWLYSHFNLIAGVWGGGRQINLFILISSLWERRKLDPSHRQAGKLRKRQESDGPHLSLPLPTSTRSGSQDFWHPSPSPLVQWEGRIKLLLLPAEPHTDQTPPGPISWELQVEAR